MNDDETPPDDDEPNSTFAHDSRPASDAGESIASPPSITASMLERLQTGVDGAWDQFVQLWSDVIYAWFRRWLLNDTVAGELTQAVLIKASGGIQRFHRDQPGDSLRGWLRTIALNVRNDYLKKRRGSRIDESVDVADLPVPPDDDESPDELSEEKTLLVQRILAMIQPDFEERTWQAFWRCDMEEHDRGDVAPDVGMSLDTLRNAIYKVRKRFRIEWQANYGNDEPSPFDH